MVIHISDELIKQADTNKDIKTAIIVAFMLFEQGKHQWYINNNDIELFQQCRSLASFSEFIEKYVVESKGYDAYEKPKYVARITDKSEIDNKINKLTTEGTEIKVYLGGKRMVVEHEVCTYDFVRFDICQTYIGQPVQIVLENLKSDKLFISTCFKYLKGIDIQDIWIEFNNGNGSETINVLRNFEGKKRVICIIDGDKINPTTFTNNKDRLYADIRSICEEYGYYLHLFNKREMENYIPDNALKDFLKATDRNPEDYDYFRLTDLRKDYFDMKQGIIKSYLKDEFWKSAINEVGITESEIAATSKKAPIITGFGKEVHKAFGFVSSEMQIKDRDTSNELCNLLDDILEML
ncbi:MAG: hypothetical protein N2749_05495 [Clostridia bacterium]|nr:hypothetical protein [Clostridia bacterium]